MARTISGLPKSMADKLTPEEIAFLQKVEKAANAAPDLSTIVVPSAADTAATLATSRTVDDSLNAVPGVDPGGSPATLGNGGGTTVGDSFKKIANILNDQYTNDANLAAAIVTLSDRINAMQATLDDLTTALTA